MRLGIELISSGNELIKLLERSRTQIVEGLYEMFRGKLFNLDFFITIEKFISVNLKFLKQERVPFLCNNGSLVDSE